MARVQSAGWARGTMFCNLGPMDVVALVDGSDRSDGK